MVKRINRWLLDAQRVGFAYRLKMGHFATQYIDVLVDSRDPALYLAIECKSLDKKKADRLYFSRYFNIDRKGVSQVERITDFITQTQRFGILALELRHGAPTPSEVYLIPWFHIEDAYTAGRKAFLDFPKIVERYPRLRKGEDGVDNMEWCLHQLRQY